jgi:predicted Zn finger-like uncharacterized protein
MAIEFTCPACGGTLRVRDAAVGRVVRCGGCLTMLRVPDAEPVPDSQQPAEPESPRRPNPRPTAPAPAFPESADAPAQPVRGPRFWLLVTAGTLALGTCGCCGLAALILPGPEWRSHESERGKFRVDLPAKASDDMVRRVQVARGKSVEGTHLWTRAEDYAIVYSERPRGSDDEILTQQVTGLTTGRDVRNVGPITAIEVGGFPGREFQYEARNGGTYTGRVVVADTRVYVLLAGGRFTRPDSENVRRFLDSFEITDPQLQRRQEVKRLRDAGAVAAATALAAAEAELGRKP